MGLSSSPRIFTKVMKPVLATLRQQGHVNSGYIDDLYLQGKNFSECAKNVTDSAVFFAFGVFFASTQMCLNPYSGDHLFRIYVKTLSS